MGSFGRVTYLLQSLLGAAALLALTACGDFSSDGKTTYPEDDNRKKGGENLYDSEGQGSVFGSDGLTIFGGEGDSINRGDLGGGGSGIGVNSFLWRASLDTISFMPLSSADPFGGVIITDWYSPPESKTERFKVNVYILGRDLRADGVRAAVFRQLQENNGNWVDASVESQTPVDLENAILTRARQLRIASAQ